MIISAIKLKFIGLFEYLLHSSPGHFKHDRDLIKTLLDTSVEGRNYPAIAVLKKHIHVIPALAGMFGEQGNASNYILNQCGYELGILKHLVDLGFDVQYQKDVLGNTVLHILLSGDPRHFITFY